MDSPQPSRNILSYLLLVAAFGLVLPWAKGLDFFNPELMAAYACMGTIFAGPAVAEAFRKKPATFFQALTWIVQAVFFGEVIVALMLLSGIVTVYVTHLNKVILQPDLRALAAAMALGFAGSLALAAWAAWLAVQFSPGWARNGLRVAFFALLVLFFFEGHWLTRVTFVGTLIAFAVAAVFMFLLHITLRTNAAA